MYILLNSPHKNQCPLIFEALVVYAIDSVLKLFLAPLNQNTQKGQLFKYHCKSNTQKGQLFIS